MKKNKISKKEIVNLVNSLYKLVSKTRDEVNEINNKIRSIEIEITANKVYSDMRIDNIRNKPSNIKKSIHNAIDPKQNNEIRGELEDIKISIKALIHKFNNLNESFTFLFFKIGDCNNDKNLTLSERVRIIEENLEI
jgi:predicted  nucleic acid-binding Zn-ribbon protein